MRKNVFSRSLGSRALKLRMRNSPVYNTAAATSGAAVPGLRRESATRPNSPQSP
jgi:hypothetical protein